MIDPPNVAAATLRTVSLRTADRASSRYSLSLYWIFRTLMLRIRAARVVEPPAISSVCRMASRSMSWIGAPGISEYPRASAYSGSAGRSSMSRTVPVAAWTAFSMMASNSRTFPGQLYFISIDSASGVSPRRVFS